MTMSIWGQSLEIFVALKYFVVVFDKQSFGQDASLGLSYRSINSCERKDCKNGKLRNSNKYKEAYAMERTQVFPKTKWKILSEIIKKNYRGKQTKMS